MERWNMMKLARAALLAIAGAATIHATTVGAQDVENLAVDFLHLGAAALPPVVQRTGQGVFAGICRQNAVENLVDALDSAGRRLWPRLIWSGALPPYVQDSLLELLLAESVLVSADCSCRSPLPLPVLVLELLLVFLSASPSALSPVLSPPAALACTSSALLKSMTAFTPMPPPVAVRLRATCALLVSLM